MLVFLLWVVFFTVNFRYVIVIIIRVLSDRCCWPRWYCHSCSTWSLGGIWYCRPWNSAEETSGYIWCWQFALAWFQLYLDGRRQHVGFGGKCSARRQHTYITVRSTIPSIDCQPSFVSQRSIHSMEFPAVKCSPSLHDFRQFLKTFFFQKSLPEL